ncbi:MAG: SurA N-terminal domain-containing protein [Pseudomonadota bacterium]
MFEYIRNHRRLIQILMGLVILSFIVTGVLSSRDSSVGASVVATVGDFKITQQEWDDAQRQQIDRYRAQLGPRFDQKEFETPASKQAVLEGLMAERAIDAEIKHDRLTIGDAALQKQIQDIAAFKKPDGTFDMVQYKAALAAQGMNPQMFDNRMRRDLVLQQLNGAIANTAFSPRALIARVAEITDQRRDVQEQLFPVTEFLSQVNVNDAMVKDYYDKNKTQFQIPEQVSIEYVVFDPAVVESQISIADAEISDFYTNSLKSFGTPEKRTASHIVISVKNGDKAAAKAKADAIQAEVRKTPASFAAVAKAQSQDPLTAAEGGALGEMDQVNDKATFPAAVLGAVFKTKPGDISDVVESEYGYHVIMVTGVKPETVKPLDEVKPLIVAELKKQKMSKKYSEMAEQFNNTVEDQFNSLKPVADKLHLKIDTAVALTRTPSTALGAAPFNNPKFLAALFSDETLKNKRNTHAIEVGASTMISGRVVEHKPAAMQPLADVTPAIRKAVASEEAIKLAKKAGEAKLAAAKASGDAAGFGEVKVVSRENQANLDSDAAKAVLRADVTKLPAYVGVEAPGKGYAVYRISKVSQPDQPNPARSAQLTEGLNGVLGQIDNYGYVEALKVKAKTKVLNGIAAK